MEARMERIGELLARGVANLVAEDAAREERRQAEREHVDAEIPELSEEHLDVFLGLCQVGELSPKELQGRLGRSRATVGRAIRLWESQGLLTRSGSTTSVAIRPTRLGL